MFPVVVPWRAAVLSFKAYKNNQMNSNILMLHPMWSLGADWLIAARTYPSFSSMKWLGVFLEGMLVHCRSLPCNYVSWTMHQYQFILQGEEVLWELSVLPKQEHNGVPGDKHTDCEATVSPTCFTLYLIFIPVKYALNSWTTAVTLQSKCIIWLWAWFYSNNACSINMNENSYVYTIGAQAL